MKSDKLVEAFVTVNSTPYMQIQAFLRHVDSTDDFVNDLTSSVFKLNPKHRTYLELQRELTHLFLKNLGVSGTLLATLKGILDKDGPVEGIKKSIISCACERMGYKNPIIL